mgnify:CR=1 FL=1
MKLRYDEVQNQITIVNTLTIPISLKTQMDCSSIWYNNDLNTFFFQGLNDTYIPKSSSSIIQYCQCGFDTISKTAFFRVRPDILEGNVNLSISGMNNLYSLYKNFPEFYQGNQNILFTTYIDDINMTDTTYVNVLATENPTFVIEPNIDNITLLNGLNSHIHTSFYSSIFSCSDCKIQYMRQSCILSGSNSNISYYPFNFNGYGNLNYIINGKNGLINNMNTGGGIMNGDRNKLFTDIPLIPPLTEGTYSFIMNGVLNTIIPFNPGNSILNGGNNVILGDSNTIMNGLINNLSYTSNSCIENGYQNSILMAQSTIQNIGVRFLSNQYISNGSRNIITSVTITDSNFIENGIENKLLNSDYSMIGSGVDNRFSIPSDPKEPTPVGGGQYSIILTGVQNTIFERYNELNLEKQRYMKSTILNGTSNSIFGTIYRFPVIYTGNRNEIRSHSFGVTDILNTRYILNGSNNSISSYGYLLNGQNNSISGYAYDFNYITNGSNNSIRVPFSTELQSIVPSSIFNGEQNSILKTGNTSVVFINCRNTSIDLSSSSSRSTNIFAMNLDSIVLPPAGAENALYLPNAYVNGSFNFRNVLRFQVTNVAPFITVSYHTHLILVELTTNVDNPINLRLSEDAQIDGKEFILRVYSSSPGVCQFNLLSDRIIYFQNQYFTNWLIPSLPNTNFTIRFFFKNRSLYIQQTSPKTLL